MYSSLLCYWCKSTCSRICPAGCGDSQPLRLSPTGRLRCTCSRTPTRIGYRSSLAFLDVDPACWTPSAVGITFVSHSLRPLLELLVSFLEGLACEPHISRSIDPHVAFTLLLPCAGFCKFAYVARTTPPSMATATFEHFDRLIHEGFFECTGVNTTKQSWLQAQLSTEEASVFDHFPITRQLHTFHLCATECASPNHLYLASSIDSFNPHVSGVSGAKPKFVSTWHALDSAPSLA